MKIKGLHLRRFSLIGVLLVAWILLSIGLVVKAGNASTESPSVTQRFMGRGRGPYRLPHRNIIPGSVVVRLGAQKLDLGTDYFIDYANGWIVLANPLSPLSALTVTYKFQTSGGAPSVPLITGPQFSFLGMNFQPVLGVNPGDNSFLSERPVLGLEFAKGGSLALLPGANSKEQGREPANSLGLSGMIYWNAPSNPLLKSLSQDPDPRMSVLSQLFPSGGKTLGLQSLYQLHLSGLSLLGGQFSASYQKVGKAFDFTPLRVGGGNQERQTLLSQLERSKGLEQWDLQGALPLSPDSRLQLGYVSAQDDKGSAIQKSLNLQGKQFQLALQETQVSPGFNRVKDSLLNNASAFEKAQGQLHRDLLFNYTPNSSLKITSTYRQIQFLGQKKTSSQFQHLLLYKPDRFTQVQWQYVQESQKTQQPNGPQTSLTQTGVEVERKTPDGLLLKASHATGSMKEGNQSKPLEKTELQVQTDEKKATAFALLHKSERTGSQSGAQQHRLFFASRLPYSMLLRGEYLSSAVRQGEKIQLNSRSSLHFETDPKRPFTFVYDSLGERKVSDQRKFQRSAILTGKVGKVFNFKHSSLLQEVGIGNREESNNFEFNLQPTARWNLAGNILDKNQTTIGNVQQWNLRLNGAPSEKVQLKTQWQYTTADAQRPSSVVDVTLLSPLSKEESVGFNFYRNEDRGILKEDRLALLIQRPLYQGHLLFSLGQVHFGTEPSYGTYALGYKSNPDPQKPLHWEIQLRRYAESSQKVFSGFKYQMDWRVRKDIAISWEWFANPEAVDSPGPLSAGRGQKVLPIQGFGFGLQTPLKKNLLIDLGVSKTRSLGNRQIVRNLRFGLKGEIDSETLVDISYAGLMQAQFKKEIPTHWWKFNLRREIAEDYFLRLVGEARIWSDVDPKTKDVKDIQARLELMKTW